MKFKNYYLSSSLDESKQLSIEAGSIHKGKMHKLLGIPEGKKISDHFKSGESLANALLKALHGDKKKTASMLAFAANIDKTGNVLDSALSYLHKKTEKEENK